MESGPATTADYANQTSQWNETSIGRLERLVRELTVRVEELERKHAKKVK